MDEAPMSFWSPVSLDNTGTYTALCELPDGYYDPPFDLAGKTVLDVGATCGEVSYYYQKMFHASKCVCIESDPSALVHLNRNRALMNVEVVPEWFNLEHLQRFKYDFVKCDVEGSEMILLEYAAEGGVLPPTVIEAHSNWIRDQFLKAGFKVTKVMNDTHVQIAVYIMTNYEKLGLIKK
jgi:ribosomal protein L11 methylase PrmA